MDKFYSKLVQRISDPDDLPRTQSHHSQSLGSGLHHPVLEWRLYQLQGIRRAASRTPKPDWSSIRLYYLYEVRYCLVLPVPE